MQDVFERMDGASLLENGVDDDVGMATATLGSGDVGDTCLLASLQNNKEDSSTGSTVDIADSTRLPNASN